MTLSTPPAAARQPKTRRPHERSLKVLISPSPLQPLTFVRLTQDGEACHYWIESHPDGSFTFEKPGFDGGDIYVVRPASAQGCSCPGFRSWGHCKHHDACRALLSAGKLQSPPVPHGDGCECADCVKLAAHAPAGHSHGIPF